VSQQEQVQLQVLPLKQVLLVAQLVQALPQPLVLVELHHEVLLQLVHLLKKTKKNYQKNLGYMF
jgi:hypothetical protein